MTSNFIKGLTLSKLFYCDAVEPILRAEWPQLRYSAGMLLHGSDALGFYTPQSMDHDWGPRLQLFLDDTNVDTYRGVIDEALCQKLPREFRGFSTHFGRLDDGVTWMEPVTESKFQHAVKIFGIRDFFLSALNWDIHVELKLHDWLTFPEQILRSLTGNGVFHDGLNQLSALQDKLRYYPHDVWLYLMACQWQRISEEEPFMGRCGQAGDELGSRIVAMRLIRDVMKLCFLIERQYAPYTKWFGTAFAQLACADVLTPLFMHTLDAQTWQDREHHLSRVYEYVADRHNSIGLTQPLPAQVSAFHDRPFRVIQAGQFADALRAVITDPEVLTLPAVGAIDQFVDSTAVLSSPSMFNRVKGMYAPSS